ncbi:MAG: dicarboxylate/amino acid:cation symporter [Gammaproteobacteria bacterium]|nr:dicarboxylate/amino acid:cation symporter [Gammaproteobacteria bacterium]
MDRRALTRNILIGMALGIVLGSIIHAIGLADDNFIMSFFVNGVIDIGGQVFIIMLKLLVVPLVFVSLVCGSSNLGDGAAMGRIGAKTVLLYLCTTAIAITLALTVARLVGPGLGLDLDTNTTFEAPEAPSLKEVVVNIFPQNPIDAMAQGNMLQVIVFAILIGVAIAKTGEPGARLKAHLEDWNEIIMRLVMMIMLIAPFGVFCLLLALFANMGFTAIADLIKYFLCVAGVLALHFVVTYGLLIRFVARLNPLDFLPQVAPVMAYAFSTSSSNATLPITLETVEHRLGVKNEVASFTVPLGATINMDGTAIMQGVATVFIAQAYGVDISLPGYLMVVLTATLASVGTAGVPGVGLIMLAMVLQQVGLPVEGIGLIIGVDRLLDMMRTAVNVTGDATVSTIVARSENAFDEDIFYSPNSELTRT